MLSIEPYVESESYVGYLIDGLNISFNPNGYFEGLTGPEVFWKVMDSETAVNEALNNKLTISCKPRILGWQILTSLFGFIQSLVTKC